MPYISEKEVRKKLDELIFNNMDILQPKGYLNYFLAKLFRNYTRNGLMSYNRAKEFIGELESAKLEIYRRWVAPYEDSAMKRNGDVE